MKTRLPNYEELARLAATVSQGMKKRPAEAVAYALALYRESQIALKHAAIEQGGVADSTGSDIDMTLRRIHDMERYKKTVPKADKFPATLDDFFRVIVKARTEADNIKRLRDFLRSESQEAAEAAKIDLETYVANQIHKIKEEDKTGGFFSEHHWEEFGGHYLDWWKQQKSIKARKSASLRKKKWTNPPLPKKNH